MVPIKEIDYRALRLLMLRSEGNAWKKERAVRKFDLAWRHGQLAIPDNESEEQKWWRCEARFLLGDYSDWSGWQYRDRWAASIWFQNPYPVKCWDGSPVDHLYIVGEQGLGDEVLFAQLIPEAKKVCKTITLETQPRLQPIFERLGVRTAPAKLNPDGMRLKQDFEADAWVSLGDLPRLYRGVFSRCPYLTANQNQIARYAALKGRVGVSWRGRQGEEKRLIEPGFLSLQYDQAWDEEVERPDLDLTNDLEGILGLLSNLERVVTVSTTVAHLAAALGVRTEVVLANPRTGRAGNILPWRWMDYSKKGRTNWYGDHVKVYENHAEYRGARRQR